jgi:hypothetical protein
VAFDWAPAALAALFAMLPVVLATALAGGLVAALAAGLAGCITSFSPRPSSATGSRVLLL